MWDEKNFIYINPFDALVMIPQLTVEETEAYRD